MKRSWKVASLALLAVVLTLGVGSRELGHGIHVTPERIEVRGLDGNIVLVYNLVVPEDVDLTVDSGGFFHPFNTPSGVEVTGLRPEDHLYHRGIFLGWIEMRGEKAADFWGWGEHAPTEDRVIHSSVPQISAVEGEFRLTAENQWVAEDEVMVQERMDAVVREKEAGNVADLEYTITPLSNITLPQRAFSGFCFRTRIDGEIQAYDPDGRVALPPPSHVDPESNWPAQPWYAYTIVLDDDEQTQVGAAVIDHPDNPESLWHNVTGIGMLNPVIVALDAVQLEYGRPLTLRYRVVAFDGDTPTEFLNQLAEEWGH